MNAIACVVVLGLLVVFDAKVGRTTSGRVPREFQQRLDADLGNRYAQVLGIFPARLSSWFFLGAWFLYQFIEANFGLFSASANGGGVAFFAHVGGFLFGLLITYAHTNAGRIQPQSSSSSSSSSGILGAPA